MGDAEPEKLLLGCGKAGSGRRGTPTTKGCGAVKDTERFPLLHTRLAASCRQGLLLCRQGSLRCATDGNGFCTRRQERTFRHGYR